MTITHPREAFETAGFHVGDLSDEQLIVAAERLVAEHGHRSPQLIDIGRVLDAVRFSERLGSVKVKRVSKIECKFCVPVPHASTPTGPALYHSKSCSHFPNQKIKPLGRKLHAVEDMRPEPVPRPKRLRGSQVHPACRAAHADGAAPCARCTPLLHAAICECAVCTAWWEEVDA